MITNVYLPCIYIVMCACLCEIKPLLGVEEGKDVLAGHEAFLHVAQPQVVHLQHVLLLFLLQGAKKRHAHYKVHVRERIISYSISEDK